MANRYFQQFSGTPVHGAVSLFGKVTTTTSGTIGSSSVTYGSVVKTATKTGRYTITLDDSYVAFLGCWITIEGTSDAAYTTGKGDFAFLRNVSVTDATPTFEIQFASSDGSPADAELEDGAVFYFRVDLKNSTAQP